MDIYLWLIIFHLIGAALGVGGATFIEIFLTKSLMDGVIDPTESGFLKITYRVVRVGLVLSLFTGFGFVILYIAHGQFFKLYNPVLWAKLTVVSIIAVNAILLQMHKISLWLGSAFSFISWYAALVIGVFLTNSTKLSYSEIMLFYILGVIIGGFILDAIRKKFGAAGRRASDKSS
jgi:hypothetical protein